MFRGSLFNVHGSVHHKNILTYVQQDATLHSLFYLETVLHVSGGRLCLKCDGTCAETRFRLLAKEMSPFKSAGGSVDSTTGRRAVHISLQGLYCSCKAVFCSHVTLTGYPLHSPVSLSLLLPCITVCQHISSAVYHHPSSGAQITIYSIWYLSHHYCYLPHDSGR